MTSVLATAACRPTRSSLEVTVIEWPYSSLTASRPSFCDGCGSACPWATREERIIELENLLDQEDIEEADRVVIQDQLKRLTNAELSDRDERQAWSVIGRRAGAALKNPSVVRLLEGLITAGLRNQLGICSVGG